MHSWIMAKDTMCIWLCALYFCMVHLVTEVVAPPSPGEVLSVGDASGVEDGYETRTRIILTDKLPVGILYKVKLFFGEKKDVYVVVFERDGDQLFKLMHLKKIESPGANQYKTMYLRNDVMECPLVSNNKTYIGLWSPNGSPVPYTGSLENVIKYDNYAERPEIGLKRKFDDEVVQYRFRISAYVYRERNPARRKKRSPTSRCPTDVEVATALATPAPTTFPTTTMKSTVPVTEADPINTEAPTASTGTPMETTDSSYGGEAAPPSALSNTAIYIIIVVLAVIVIIAIITVVCCVIRKRSNARKRKAAGLHTENIQHPSKMNAEVNPAFNGKEQSPYEQPGIGDQAEYSDYTPIARPESNAYEDIDDGKTHGNTRARVLPSLPPGLRAPRESNDDADPNYVDPSPNYQNTSPNYQNVNENPKRPPLKPKPKSDYLEPTPYKKVGEGYVDMSGRQPVQNNTSTNKEESAPQYLELRSDQ